MKIILSPDSFKNCMSSENICEYLSEGIKSILPNANIVNISLSDGGEGFVESAMKIKPNGLIKKIMVNDPLGRQVEANYYTSNDNDNYTIIEVASAVGIEYLTKEELNPYNTTSYGVGEIIKTLNCKKVIIGLGGSCTIDGGMGMLQALGVDFYDNNNNLIKTPATGRDLLNFKYCDSKNLSKNLKDIEFISACDVNNILCGENGSAKIFGPQKGATSEMIIELDKALSYYQTKISEHFHKELNCASDGAAGGLGFALRMLGSKRCSGAEFLLELADFDEKSKDATIIITGEGCSDNQTIEGKLPSIIADHAKSLGVKCILISGAILPNSEELRDKFDATFALSTRPCSLEECMLETPKNLYYMGRNIASLLS